MISSVWFFVQLGWALLLDWFFPVRYPHDRTHTPT